MVDSRQPFLYNAGLQDGRFPQPMFDPKAVTRASWESRFTSASLVSNYPLVAVESIQRSDYKRPVSHKYAVALSKPHATGIVTLTRRLQLILRAVVLLLSLVVLVLSLLSFNESVFLSLCIRISVCNKHSMYLSTTVLTFLPSHPWLSYTPHIQSII
jgi:hypothetical protein